MNFIEVKKHPKEVCINSFKEFILNNFDYYTILKLGSTGQLTTNYLRGIAWKIFLGVLNKDESLDKWKLNLTYLRTEYKIISDKVIKQQNYIEETDKQKLGYSNDIKTSLLKTKSIVNNPFKPEKETKELINLDLSRTFQELSLFHDEKIKNKLSHILFVWSKENSDVGYQQGMNDILSIIFLALYPYYFKNENINDKKDIINAKSLYLFFHDEDEFESDLYICFDKAMKKGIKKFYEFEFEEKEKQDIFISSLCLFKEEIKNINEEINTPLNIRCSMIINEKLKRLDYQLYKHFNEIGLNCTIFLQRWLKCVFNREFELKNILIIWDAIFSSSNINEEYDLTKIDMIALSMILRIREFLLLCDQNQCFMILLQYPRIDDILELIIFSDKLNEAIIDLLSGKKSLFLDNITNFEMNYDFKNDNKDENINKINEKENNEIKEINPIKNYEEGIKRLGNIFIKYHSLMEINDEKEFLNIIHFFNNYK